MPLLARAPRPDYDAALQIVLNLPAALAAAQTRIGLTTTQQAKQVGIGVATLTSLVDGTTTNPTRSTIVASLRWLAANA